MASNESTPRVELSDSAVTLPSDSENYSATIELAPPSGPAPAAPVTLYTPPSYWRIIQGAAINLILPFVNGLMLGFGELFAHEAAFRLGWSNTKVFPTHRRTQQPIGGGIDLRDIPQRRR
ncbi:mitochondrial import protein [Trichophyton mentagrophytes]|nr:mitochondrial import protein [Trichophyton mentagrophytes]